MFDTTPTILLQKYGNILPPRYVKAFRRNRLGQMLPKSTSWLVIPSRGRIRGCGKQQFFNLGDTPRIDSAHRGRHRGWPPRAVANAANHLTTHRRSGPHRYQRPPSFLDLHLRPVEFHRRSNRDRDRGCRAIHTELPRHRGCGAYGVHRANNRLCRRPYCDGRQFPAACDR